MNTLLRTCVYTIQHNVELKYVSVRKVMIL